MKITVSHVQYTFNRATRKSEPHEITEGFAVLPAKVETQLRLLAPKYKMSVPELVALALTFYFGDGMNHLACEHCEWFESSVCEIPSLGEQTTIPVLD